MDEKLTSDVPVTQNQPTKYQIIIIFLSVLLLITLIYSVIITIKYLHQPKPVSGLIQKTVLPTSVSNQPDISPIPLSIPTNSPTVLPADHGTELSAMKTFTNQTYKYEFQYPGNWKVSDTNLDDVLLSSNNSEALELPAVSFEVSKIGYDEFLSKYVKADSIVDNSQVKPENYRLGNITAKKLVIATAMGTNTFLIYFQHNENSYVISGPELSEGVLKTQFGQILSTLKFSN